MARGSHTWDLHFTVQVAHLLDGSRHVILFGQGRIISYFGLITVTYVSTLEPLVSRNKMTPSTPLPFGLVINKGHGVGWDILKQNYSNGNKEHKNVWRPRAG